MDLSATPFFLRGSGYTEGTLFPWTMCDFSLMDAIECGIVKLPRVPVAENTPGDEMPMYRKFTQQGQVRISARREAFAGDNEIVFDISDTGRGMTSEEQAKLFTPFTKLAAKKGNRTGTGLGLVISKGFTELMKGTISLKSEFGQGTTFTVRLPASATPVGEDREGSQSSSMLLRDAYKHRSIAAARTSVVPQPRPIAAACLSSTTMRMCAS